MRLWQPLPPVTPRLLRTLCLAVLRHSVSGAGFSVTSRPSGLAGAASDGEGDAGGRVEHQDPDLESAINSVPPIPVCAEKLSKSGWVTHDTLKLLVGRKPKAFRTPVSRHPRCMIRKTWLFRDGSWSKAEDKVDMRALGNKTAKLDSPAIMSLTIFERPEDDPEEVPDSDRGDSAPEARSRSVESLKAEALTPEHMFTHRPKNPYCKICQRAKMLAPRARKRGGSSTIESKAFGDHITIDHVVTRDLRDYGLENEKVAFVVKDVFSKFRYVYPSPTKEADQCHEDLQHFLQVGDKVGVVYSDNAPELKDAVRRMKFRHNTSRAYVDENIEREIRTVLEGTRANLTQAGLPDSLWPYAAQRHAMALNATKRLDVARIPWEDRFGTPFDGLMIPFGAKVLFWNNPKQNVTEASKFSPTGEEGIFLGFHIQPGFIWRKGALKFIGAKRVEVPHGDYTFPLADEEPSKPPRLDDQDCFADGAGPDDDDNDDGPPNDDAPGGDDGSDPNGDQPGPPSGEADEDDKAVEGSKPGERITVDGMTFGDLFGGSDSEEDEGPVPSSGSRDRPPAEPKAKPKPKPTPSKLPEGVKPTLFDPFRFPDGRPVPQGYDWDGVRLVRNEKGSLLRPPDTPSEIWYHYSQQQRDADIARWNRLVELHEERVRRERRDAAPAMPVVHEETNEQRARLTTLYWDKLDEVTHDQFALVARVVLQAEMDRTPEAKAAMDKEWQKLVDKFCWLEKKGSRVS